MTPKDWKDFRTGLLLTLSVGGVMAMGFGVPWAFTGDFLPLVGIAVATAVACGTLFAIMSLTRRGRNDDVK